MRSSRGFTLIELMVTVTVLAIVLSIAVPGFTDLMRSNSAQSQSSAIAAALNLARSEAARRGAAVAVVADANGWVQGWRVGLDANRDGDLSDSGDLLIRQFPPLSGEGVALAGAVSGGGAVTVVRFGAQGQLLKTDGSGNAGAGVTATLAFSMGDSHCSLARNIVVNHLGRVSITRKACTP